MNLLADGQLALNLWPDLLPTDPDDADLGEPFAVHHHGAWLVVRWALIPKQIYAGWWVPHYWAGPDTRTWIGTDGPIPDRAARFTTLAQATEALAADHTGGQP